jgi:hypothetical protein
MPMEVAPNGWASAARHRSDRQPSKRMLNFRSWAGRLHAGVRRVFDFGFCCPHDGCYQIALETHWQTVFGFVGRHDCPLEATCHLTLRLSKVAAMYSLSL